MLFTAFIKRDEHVHKERCQDVAERESNRSNNNNKKNNNNKLIQDFEEFNGITIVFFFVRGQTFNWFIGQEKKAQPEPLLRSLYILNRTTLSSSA